MAIVRIQQRRDTASNWTSANPTLAPGEMGIETDTDKFKLGNGSTAWTSLGYGGIQGPAGADGTNGVVAATSPVTYDSGTSTVGIDQTAIGITTSQISDLTATAAELNILDGVTATTAELNILDGVTADATELNYVDGVTSGIQSQLDDKALLTPAVNAKTAAYTLAVGDRGETITADGTFTLTAPSATFSAGDRVDFVNIGTGVITFAGSGVTVNSKDAALTIASQWAAASILFLSSSTAVLIGDLA
jgi:hypothetical protein